jgi:RNA polymerase sigma factor for flagellar operon FliA
VQAAQRYRGEVGASFGAYAARRVRGQVLDALRDRDPLTRSARRAYREAQKVAEDLPPPYVEISLDRLAELGDGGVRQPDAVGAADTRRDPRWHGVARELRSLTKTERRVLVLSYGRGLTLREIGLQIGLSESGVCRVRARALRRLRSALAVEQEAA